MEGLDASQHCLEGRSEKSEGAEISCSIQTARKSQLVEPQECRRTANANKSRGLERLRRALPHLEQNVADHRGKLRSLEQNISVYLLPEITRTVELLQQYETDVVDDSKPVTGTRRQDGAVNDEIKVVDPLERTAMERRQNIEACQSACDSLRRHFEVRLSVLCSALSLLEQKLVVAKQHAERDCLCSAGSRDSRSVKEAFDALVVSLKGTLSTREMEDIQKEEEVLETAGERLDDAFGVLEERCSKMEKDISWSIKTTTESLEESCSLLRDACVEGQNARAQYKRWKFEAVKAQSEAETCELERTRKEGEVERLLGRIQQSEEDFKMAQHQVQLGDLENISPEERSRLILQKIRSYDRAIKCIATLSPLFMVERTSKCVILQYKCPDGSDLEILVDRLNCEEKVVIVKPRTPGLEKEIMSKLRFVIEERDIARLISRELSHHFVDYTCPAPFGLMVSPTIEMDLQGCTTTIEE